MPRRIAPPDAPAPAAHYDRDGILALEGDMREVLAGMEGESFTACITDPPYHLTSQRSMQRSCIPGRYVGKKAAAHGFMGKTWDGGRIAFDPATWRAILRVLKPGGMLIAFGGTRTYHHLACAVENAGFEVRDCMMWLQGQGFAKGLNIALQFEQKLCERKDNKWFYLDDRKEMRSKPPFRTEQANIWFGWNVALKPAWEPIILAMKPLDGGYARNALRHGVAGLNVDGGRIHLAKDEDAQSLHDRSGGKRGFKKDKYVGGDVGGDVPPGWDCSKGRWPANVILSHDPRCVQVGVAPSPGYKINRFKDGAKPFGGGAGHEYESERVPGGEVEVWACVPGCPVRMLDEQSGDIKVPRPYRQKGRGSGRRSIGMHVDTYDRVTPHYGDSGGASRFFYTAKASTSERSAGLSPAERNAHPTVKPVDLMRYLITLVTMPSGTRILDPFMGSGSTLVAAKQLGIECVGVELERASCVTTAARLSRRTSKGVGKRRKIKCRGRSRRKAR